MDMRRDKNMTRQRTLPLVAIVLIAGCAMYFPAMILVTGWYAGRMQVRLLCKTDHRALLQACRELSRRASIGELRTGRYRVGFFRRSPVVSGFPQPILDLRPTSVYIDPTGRVMVEMLGGLGHFGVYAYPADFNERWPNFEYRNRELIPGLWYYDDGYDGNPRYQKKIEELLKKRKQAH